QQPRLAQQRAGDRQALALAAGELHAHLADPRRQPLAGLLQQVGARGLLERRDHLFIGGVGLHELQVLAQRAGKQVRLLGHEADGRTTAMLSPSPAANDTSSSAFSVAPRWRKLTPENRICATGPISTGDSGRRSIGLRINASKFASDASASR